MPESALKLGQTYRWYLNFDCDRAENNGFDLFVSGWIKRVEKDGNVVWYDEIDHLATKHFANPTDSDLNTAWSQMLTTLNMVQLIEARLVDHFSSSTGVRSNK